MPGFRIQLKTSRCVSLAGMVMADVRWDHMDGGQKCIAGDTAPVAFMSFNGPAPLQAQARDGRF